MSRRTSKGRSTSSLIGTPPHRPAPLCDRKNSFGLGAAAAYRFDEKEGDDEGEGERLLSEGEGLRCGCGGATSIDPSSRSLRDCTSTASTFTQHPATTGVHAINTS